MSIKADADQNRAVGIAGVCAALRDQSRFGQAYLRFGTVTWPGESAIAPAMVDEIKANGEWVLD